mgnify:CR=1 FL=1
MTAKAKTASKRDVGRPKLADGVCSGRKRRDLQKVAALLEGYIPHVRENDARSQQLRRLLERVPAEALYQMIDLIEPIGG